MKTYHILTLLVVFLFTGCLKEEKMSIETLIKVNMPEGFESMNPEGIDVKLYSTTSGLTYTSKCDASGIATFNVEYGFYEAVAQHRERGENTIDIFNGRMERIVLSESAKDGRFTTPLVKKMTVKTMEKTLICLSTIIPMKSLT